MIAFQRVPGDAVARPLLDVVFGVDPIIAQRCLVDSGALGIRLSGEAGRQAGVELPAEPTRPDIVVGGLRTQVFEVEHELALELDGEAVRWTAPVAFCDPWPHPFGLLGLRGFLDVFDVTIEGAQRRFDLRRAA